MKLKKGDKVKVMIGKDKGKTGKIIQVIPGRSMVVVEGVNQFKRHVKSRVKEQKSEIITITKPLYASKVAIIDTKTKKPSKIGYVIEKGKKLRVSKKSGARI